MSDFGKVYMKNSPRILDLSDLNQGLLESTCISDCFDSSYIIVGLGNPILRSSEKNMFCSIGP